MKKVFLLLLIGFSLAVIPSESSGQKAMTNPNGLALDSASNSTAEGPTIKIPGFQNTASFVINITKISGTVGGILSFQGSNNGTHYATIDTKTITDGNQVWQFVDNQVYGKSFLYYRLLITGEGTMQVSYSATAYYTRQ